MKGKCHLCNQVKELSFEHVPPKSAFNNKRAFYYTGNDFLKHIGTGNLPWDFSGLKPTQSQRGMGGYTLCKECNNRTGHWYGDAFAQFIVQGYKHIYDFGGLAAVSAQKSLKFNFKGIHPQRIVKQLLCMFFSINNPDLCVAKKDLAELVQNPNSNAVGSGKYTLVPYVNTGKLIRNLGITTSLNIYNGQIRVISELSALPFGFTLEFDSKEAESINIIDWINTFNYNDQVDLELVIPVYEANTTYPADFRTKQEIQRR